MEPITSQPNNAAPQFVIVYQPAPGTGRRDGNYPGSQPAAGKTPRFLTEVMALMEANLNNPHFTVEHLSRKMGMSYSSLNRKLGRYTGQGAVQLLRNMRLQQACALLGRGDHSISEVAYETGFTTPAYFSRIFSREMGFPPSEYPSVNKNKI
ncbi:MAG: helix-turn-helix transcriptional regulator [Lewinellaceae bacterium]|nr:helix-turn-helix transcriptional regulator [Phaeodactylibacter sp.]MCB9346500.1 helix-turn-helix transcriptional regulator [Lewinellaceae bacterium]